MHEKKKNFLQNVFLIRHESNFVKIKFEIFDKNPIIKRRMTRDCHQTFRCNIG